MTKKMTTVRKGSRSDPGVRVAKLLVGMIAERTGEPKVAVLRRIVERAEALQRRARQRATKRSGFIPSSGARVAAKSRT